MNFPLNIRPGRKTLQATLLAVAAVLAGVFAWELYSGPGKGAAVVEKADGKHAFAEDGYGAASLPVPRPEEFYSVVASKDLFSPGRSRRSVAAPAAVQDEAAPGYVLEGVLILGSGRTAIVRRSGSKAAGAAGSGGEALRVRVGEAVDRYTVTHIDRDGLVMVSPSGQETRLGLFSIESAAGRRHTKTTQTTAPVDPGAFMPQPRQQGAMPGPSPNRGGGITPNR